MATPVEGMSCLGQGVRIVVSRKSHFSGFISKPREGAVEDFPQLGEKPVDGVFRRSDSGRMDAGPTPYLEPFGRRGPGVLDSNSDMRGFFSLSPQKK